MTNRLTIRQQWLLMAVMTLLIAATRYNHFFSQTLIADATWAAMFIAGLIVTLRYALPLLLLTVVSIDMGSSLAASTTATTGCLTAAYPFLLVAYASLWAMGRLTSRVLQPNMRGMAAAYAGLSVGVAVAFVISNVSWYMASPEAHAYSPFDYAIVVSHYALSFWQGALTWLSIGIVAFVVAHKIMPNRQLQHSSNQT